MSERYPYDGPGGSPGAPGYASGVRGGDNGGYEFMLNDDPNIRRVALLRRLGLAPTGRGYIASRVREAMPKAYEAVARFQQELGASAPGGGQFRDHGALMDNFANMYRSGNMLGGMRGIGQAALNNRALLDDLDLPEAFQSLGAATQLASFGMPEIIQKSRLRALEDARDTLLSRDEAAWAGGQSYEAPNLMDYLFGEGAQYGRRLGVIR